MNSPHSFFFYSISVELHWHNINSLGLRIHLSSTRPGLPYGCMPQLQEHHLDVEVWGTQLKAVKKAIRCNSIKRETRRSDHKIRAFSLMKIISRKVLSEKEALPPNTRNTGNRYFRTEKTDQEDFSKLTREQSTLYHSSRHCWLAMLLASEALLKLHYWLLYIT